jgi:2-iminobutanoate/2-iminopropanoate deaminase
MSLSRIIIEPKNPMLNASKNMKLPHSPGVRAGDFIYLSGMVSIDPETGKRSPGTVEHETRVILQNMAHMLESAGSSLSRAVKVNVNMIDIMLFDGMNEVYKEFFPVNPPARTTCGVQLSMGLKVEIEVVALYGEEPV